MTQPTALNYVTCEFGRKGSWIAGYHTGIDYRAAVGTEIYATRRGRVVIAGWDKSYGNYVVVESWHKTKFIRHYYCHLSKFYVKRGQRIYAGTTIGLSGETGNATGPHLHYEERVAPFGYWNHQRPVLPEWKPAPKTYKKILRKIGVLKKK